ncbi:MAG: hypothetical protein C4557_10540 [Anaerolineaceae bacterium]|nr:MAG: hypothetical protein C4557_10540 [Anaerolineaceae bacterium]
MGSTPKQNGQSLQAFAGLPDENQGYLLIVILRLRVVGGIRFSEFKLLRLIFSNRRPNNKYCDSRNRQKGYNQEGRQPSGRRKRHRSGLTWNGRTKNLFG